MILLDMKCPECNQEMEILHDESLLRLVSMCMNIDCTSCLFNKKIRITNSSP